MTMGRFCLRMDHDAASAAQEPWLLGVLALQALLFLSVIVFRKHANYNLFVLILAGKPLDSCS